MNKTFVFLLMATLPVSAQPVKPNFWYHKPMRILQTVLRQPDAAHYNVDSLVRYMKSVSANTLVVNGGGVVDFFQNDLPMSRINPYLGSRDLLGEIVTGCHQANIKVIARVDFRGVEKERYEQHPDWFARDEAGKPVILNYTTPPLYAPCYNSPYRNEHAVRFIHHIMGKYHLDGIWHNSVNFHHTCYCDRCQRGFKELTGKEIPLKSGTSGDWEEYYKWNEGVAGAQLQLMRQAVKKYGEDKTYAAEVFDMYKVEQQKHTGISLYSAAEYFDFFVIVAFVADNTAKVEYKDIWYPGAIIKFLKSLQPDKAPVILFGGNGTEHRYIYAPPLDSRLWLWEAAAAGGGFWNCYFNGYYPANAPDARNAFMSADAYEYLRRNETFLQGLQPQTDVGIMYSKPSGEQMGDLDFANYMRGIQRWCAENHIQYGFISDKFLSLEKLNDYKIVVLPNVSSLSELQVNILKTWVNQGGRLIASFQTSLYDELGRERPDFGLGEVMGVNYLHQIVNTEMDCYQKIIQRHALVRGMEKTTLLHNAGKTLMTRARPGAEIITGYLPKINNQPPENAFPESWESDHPILVTNRFGKGRCVYFANELEKLNSTIGHPDYDQLLGNAVNYLLDKTPVLKTNAPASVHLYLNRSPADPKTFQLSLVNTSSSSLRPFRQLIPVENIIIELPITISSVEPLYNADHARLKFKSNTLSLSHLGEFYALKIRAR